PGEPPREEGGEGDGGKGGEEEDEKAAPVPGAKGGHEAHRPEYDDRTRPVRPEPPQGFGQVGEETKPGPPGVLRRDVHHPLRVARREEPPERIGHGEGADDVSPRERAPARPARPQEDAGGERDAEEEEPGGLGQDAGDQGEA